MRSLLVLSLLSIACGPPQAHYTYVVGSSVPVPTLYGPCTSSPGVAIDRFEARTVGSTRLSCRDGVLVLDVRPAARIAISPVVSAPNGARLEYGLTAYDASGTELDHGDLAVRWTFGGALAWRSYPGCGDILPICPRHNDGFAIATGPGVGTVEAELGSVRASTTTTITP